MSDARLATAASDPPTVVVMGQGYVGLPIAMASVDAGHRVVGFDVDTERVKRLLDAHSFVDDVSDATLEAALAAGYRPTADIEDCAGFDVAVVTVPTPFGRGPGHLVHKDAALSWPPSCDPAARSCWSRPRTRAPPRNCWHRSLMRVPGWRRATTTTWATALSASTREIPPGADQHPKVVSGINPSSFSRARLSTTPSLRERCPSLRPGWPS